MFAAFLFAATPLEKVNDLFSRWWIVTGNKSNATFVYRKSISGPSSARLVDVLNVLPRTVGIKAQSMTYQFDCVHHLVTTLRLEGLDADGRNLGTIPAQKATKAPIIPDTMGDYVSRFACDEKEGVDPQIGYVSMLPPFKAADHFFRLMGVGINYDIAAGLSGMDAEVAPKAFEYMLNALIPTEQHLMVRAIKTPHAKLEE